MANILLNIEHGIEVAAEDALKFVTGAQQDIAKLGPGAVAALGVLLGAVAKVAADASTVATQPLNITIDISTVNDLKQVWPAVESFAKAIGITL